MEGKTREVVESFSLLLQPLPKRFYDKTEHSQGFFTAELWRARSTMSKKIWLSMHSRNFGSDKIVLTYVRPPLLLSRGETLHFKHPAFFCGKSHGHRDFKRETERKKQQQQQESRVFLSTKF